MKIAILGKMRSGKDTFADYFISRGFQNHSFGSGIGEVIREYFPEAWAEGKPRKHYQVIGQSFRQLDPAIWVKDLHDRLAQYRFLDDTWNPAISLIITDLRQQNEYEYLKNNGFMIVKVEAADEIRLERIAAAGDQFDPETLQHETETEIDAIAFDYLVTNNGTLEELFQQADFILSELEEEERWVL